MQMEEQHPIWVVPVNMLNKQLRTADKGGPPAWGLVRYLQLLTVKTGFVTKDEYVPQTRTDTLV
jgi:hypothetical protein